MKKVILFNNIISPTNTQLFNSLYILFNKKWIEFKVFFNALTEGNRTWDYKKEVKKYKFKYIILEWNSVTNKWNKDNHYFHINKGLKALLDKEKPDLIIHWGWAGSSAFVSNYWCKNNNKKYYLWAWSTKYENSWRRIITKPLVKYLVKKSDGYLAYWTRAWEYLENLWADKNKIQMMYNTVDIDFFINQANLLKDNKEELKLKYWIKTKHVLLFVWQLIERKWIYQILKWFKNFQKNNSDISLIFVWNWWEQTNLEKIIKEQKIKNIFFPWFFQKDKISELYVLADIFTLPSTEEVWWLVINEAMCFWLPIITENKVWASVDLIVEWKNGYIMKDNTWEEFESGLNFVFENNLIVNNNSLDIIKKFRVEDIIESLKF